MDGYSVQASNSGRASSFLRIMSIDSMAKGERDDEWHFTLLLARAHELQLH
jgi:hypothetical protein